MFHKVLLALFYALAAGAHVANGTPTPNVVLLITDDQGYGDLSCHGNPVVKTPNLDALHAESVRFTNFHVSPTCSPTRGALMSGHYTNRAGTWHTILGRSLLFEGETTLGEAFAAAGYATGMFGKWHLGDNYPYRPEDRGFGRVVRHGGGGIGQTPDVWDNAYFDDTYFCDGKLEERKGYCTDVFFDETKRFIESSAEAGKPFFAYLSTNAPHGPMLCPEKYTAPYRDQVGEKQAVFFGMIANIDENVGKLRDWLAEKGLAENTIFIFMTDNGTVAGAKVFNAGMRGNKGSHYDGGHRVPFFVHWPAGGLSKPVDVDRLSAHIDVLPTLQEVCKLPVDESYKLDGVSLAPLLHDPQADWPERIIITDSQRQLHPKKWRSCSIMTDRWRLTNGNALWDIEADPGQKKNLVKDHPQVVAELRAAYEAWWESLSPSLSRCAEITVGNPKENPTRLTCHDWLVEKTDKGYPAWYQAMIREGNTVMGPWALRVERAGRYRISLRRWPAEAGATLGAALPAGAGVPGMTAARETPGKAFDIRAAGIEFGDLKLEKQIDAGSEAAVFETRLPEGSGRLMAYFKLADGAKIGAYYAYVERLED